EMRESKVYRIKPGEGINLGCTIPSSTPQPAMYYIAGANFTDAKPPEKETEEEPEEEPDAEPEKKSDAVDILEMLTIKNGAICVTIGAVAVLHHTDKNGPTIDVTISI